MTNIYLIYGLMCLLSGKASAGCGRYAPRIMLDFNSARVWKSDGAAKAMILRYTK